MLQTKLNRILQICLLLVLFFACATENKKEANPIPGNENTDRKAMLTFIADSIIVPSYSSFKVKLDLMVGKSEVFRLNPNPTSLIEFRQAWVDAYIEWQKIELFDVGPAEIHTLRYFFNIYPANVQGINENISMSNADMEFPASYPKQGFPALDYLINGLGTTDDAILSYYTTASDAANRIAYLKRITDQMNNKFEKVYSEWKEGYKETFISKTSIDASSSTSLLVNGYILNYERYIRAGKFGFPSGAVSGGTPFPEKTEAYFKKDLSLTLAKTAHQSSIDFFNGKNVLGGKEGFSLKKYLNGINAKNSQTGNSLSETINAQFDVVTDKLNALKPNLSEETAVNNLAMVSVYNEMQKATRMLKVDMSSAMSITISYADNDGD